MGRPEPLHRPEATRRKPPEVLGQVRLLTAWNTFDQLHAGRGLDPPAVAQRLTMMFRQTLCRPEPLAAADGAAEFPRVIHDSA